MSYRHRHIGPKIKRLRSQKPWWKRAGVWMLICICLVVGGIGYFIFFFPGVQIRNITIEGTMRHSPEEIKNIAEQRIQKKILGFSSTSTLAVRTKKITQDIVTTFPDIETATTKRVWLHGIAISITEREPIATFCNMHNQCYAIDRSGIIFNQLQQKAPEGSIILKKEVAEENMFDGAYMIDRQLMDTLHDIETALQSFNLRITQAIIDNPLIVTTSEGWKIYFGERSDIPQEIKKLTALLTDRITLEDRKSMKYLYLQYKDRAYYK